MTSQSAVPREGILHLERAKHDLALEALTASADSDYPRYFAAAAAWYEIFDSLRELKALSVTTDDAALSAALDAVQRKWQA